MTWRHALDLAVGVALVVLGFLDVHVYVVSIVVGLWLVGATSGDLVAAIITTKSSRREQP